MSDEEETTTTLTKAEEAIVEDMLDSFDEATPEVRVAAFEALLANYCHECGEEQPDDPEEECPCTEALDEEDEEDEEDDDEGEESDDEESDDEESEN